LQRVLLCDDARLRLIGNYLLAKEQEIILRALAIGASLEMSLQRLGLFCG
jgi:hypothetical protein